MNPKDQFNTLEESYRQYDKLKVKFSEMEKVASENAQLANNRAAVIINLKSQIKEIEARCMKHEGHEHCVTPCDSIRIQEENHNAWLDMRGRLIKTLIVLRKSKSSMKSSLRYYKLSETHPEGCGCEPSENWYEPECIIASEFQSVISQINKLQGKEN